MKKAKEAQKERMTLNSNEVEFISEEELKKLKVKYYSDEGKNDISE